MRNNESGIATLPRFIYLNGYAWLLLCVGAGVAVAPCYEVSYWLVALQAAVVLPCLRGAYSILRGWGDKKRKYRVLMERNAPELRPDTFTEFMQAPCGKLLVRLVLKDLGREDAYASLALLEEPWPARLRESCQRQKTTIRMNEDFGL